MTHPHSVTDPSSDPRQDLQRLTRSLRLRLEGDGRAGLSGVSTRFVAHEPAGPLEPAAEAAGYPPRGENLGAPGTSPAAPAAGSNVEIQPPLTPDAIASALSSELADEIDAAAESLHHPAAAEGEADRLPAAALKGPELFDLHSPDTEGGVSREDALARVAAEVAQCTLCPELVACRTRTVPGTGNPYAKLMFIGEGPGQDEDRQGLPFVGRSGELLTKMIAGINMTRDEVFIANIVKCRPPDNRQPAPLEASNCRPYLMRQLQIVRPKVIVCLGATAAQNLLGTADPIGRLRGRFHPFMGIQVMPTFHPAYILRNYTVEARKKVYDDLLKAKAELEK